MEDIIKKVEKVARKEALAQLNKTRAEAKLPSKKSLPRLWWSMYAWEFTRQVLRSKADPKCPLCLGSGYTTPHWSPCSCLKDCVNWA